MGSSTDTLTISRSARILLLLAMTLVWRAVREIFGSPYSCRHQVSAYSWSSTSSAAEIAKQDDIESPSPGSAPGASLNLFTSIFSENCKGKMPAVAIPLRIVVDADAVASRLNMCNVVIAVAMKNVADRREPLQQRHSLGGATK